MVRANKRRKRNSYHNHNGNTPHSDAIPVEHSEGSSSRSSKQNIHSGKGIQNSNGHIRIGRDYSAQHTYNNFRIRSATLNQASNDPNATIVKEKHRKILISSLKFSQIDARRTNIKGAHAKTCQWFLKTQEYIDWLDINRFDDHGGLLWVKGKPGVGKSTLMSSTFSRVRPKLKEKGNIVVSFFFNARGEDLERTTSGLYRALLVQLFEERPHLQNILDDWFVSEWTVESLKTLLEEAILAIGKASIVYFIDALDECNEKEIRDMLSFLQNMGEQAAPNRTRLHICFASRHYPHITIHRGLNLIIERQIEHDKDIVRYLDTELRIGHGALVEKIRSDLQEKSSGIFMWVVIVVSILNKEYDRGRIHKLAEILRRIPSDLHDLFLDILTRDNDNPQGLLLCIQWVLFAKRPLSPKELYLAIMYGIDPDGLSTCHESLDTDVDANVIKNYILDNSKGLAESTRSTTPTVQFIHESIRDFLLKDKGFWHIWPDLEFNFEGESHEVLKQCCLHYMQDDTIPTAASNTKITGDFGFFRYANENILYHAEKAATRGINQSEFLTVIPLDNFIKYANLFQTSSLHDLTSTASLRYILALTNAAALIRAQGLGKSCFDVENERYGAPIFAALAMRNYQAAEVLLELQAEILQPGSKAYALCKRFAEFKEKINRYSASFEYVQSESILHNVVAQDDDFILEILLSWKKPHGNLSPLLVLPVNEGYHNIVRLLVDNGADVKSCYGRKSLHLAVKHGHADIIGLLLDSTADYTNIHINILMDKAVWKGHGEVVQVLLDRGANVEGSHKSTQLYTAASRGNESVVKVLLDNEANIESLSNDTFGETPLHCAARHGDEIVASLLLECGANVNSRDETNRTPLLASVNDSFNVDMAKLLLSSGADVNAADDSGITALSSTYYLSPFGDNLKRLNVARLLLENGAAVNSRDGDGNTPLFRALVSAIGPDNQRYLDFDARASEFEANFKLHLDHGADINAKNNKGDTSFSIAKSNEHQCVGKLFLACLADSTVGTLTLEN